MTAAEVARTPAYRIPRGAQIVGGPRDGLTVTAAAVRMFDRRRPTVVLLLSDGSQAEYPSHEQIDWLHPGRRTPT